MGQFVQPKVFLVGATAADVGGITEYLKYTKQEDFYQTFTQAMRDGLSSGEALCSMFAKLCYKSLVLGKNANVSRVRDVQKNLESCHDTGHGSVFEHCQLNFIVTDCSRVFTHEQVRHRSGPPHGRVNSLESDMAGDGWAYAQTSGRYCRLDSIDMVWDSILDPVKDIAEKQLKQTEDAIYLMECKLGLRKPNPKHTEVRPENWINLKNGEGFPPLSPGEALDDYKWVPDDTFDFETRKKMTSAIRRFAPNGQANEIGMSMNIRSLRHTIQVRTARFAEREIRNVYAQVYNLVKERFPTIFYRARTRTVDGLPEIYGMKCQPYEVSIDDPKALEFWDAPALEAELARRHHAADTIKLAT